MRLIDADALHELIDGGYDLNFDEVPETKRELLRMVDNQETIDAVPVVRCKECKLYWKNHNDWMITLDCLMSRNDDGFCHRGERKDNV